MLVTLIKFQYNPPPPFRNRARRKKASVEQMLKTAMQNQLDGARVGLKQLESCLEDIREADAR